MPGSKPGSTSRASWKHSLASGVWPGRDEPEQVRGAGQACTLGPDSPVTWVLGAPGVLFPGKDGVPQVPNRPRKGMAEAAGPLPQTPRHTARRAQGPSGCWGGTGPLSHLIRHLAQGCQPPSQPPGQKPGLPQPADQEAATSLPPGLTSTPTQPTWPSSPGLPRHMAGLLPCPTCPPVLQRQPCKASTGLRNPRPGLRGL